MEKMRIIKVQNNEDSNWVSRLKKFVESEIASWKLVLIVPYYEPQTVTFCTKTYTFTPFWHSFLLSESMHNLYYYLIIYTLR